MSQTIQFGRQGLPPLVTVKPNEQVTIEVTPEGKTALYEAMGAQGIRPQYQGVEIWSGAAVGTERRVEGDKSFLDTFAPREYEPGSGQPGLYKTAIKTIDINPLKPGESVEFWIELIGGKKGYFSNFGANMTVKAQE